jgi:beta-glucosidase
MVKHFPGGGPQQDGEDPHFPYGREQVYPAGMFDYHLRPFDAAFAVGTRQVMTSYGIPVGIGYEEVACAFNREIVTGLLRERYGFDGVVCADWGVLTDDVIFGKELPARAWGVEHLSLPERAKKAIDAGIDMFGGESCPEAIVELVQSGKISEERIDRSARRLLREKFRLGLFEWPYVDAEAVNERVGGASHREASLETQRRSIVLLKNDDGDGSRILPIELGTAIWLEGIDPVVAAQFGTVVDDLDRADAAIVRLSAPFEPRDRYGLEDRFPAGSLAFGEEEKARILAIAARKPTIVAIDLSRPAVIPDIASASAALLGTFGASDVALLDVLFGRSAPSGRLPFELPSSMAAVERQAPDAPYGSIDPLYPFGHGLAY